jgi:hypothetical protein
MKIKEIFVILPVLFDARPMCFMGSRGIIVTAIGAKVEVDLIIIHILFTIIHLLIPSSILLCMLI